MIANLRKQWRERRPRLAVALVVLGGVGTITGMHLRNRPPAIPIAEVKRGDFVDSLQLRGEVKALRSVSISAPAEAGDLQIIKIAEDGAQMHKGDVVVEFDKTKTVQDLAQFKSALKAADAEIEQARAQARLKQEENVTAVMRAHFEVETAKLEVSKQEIVSKIEGEEAKLKLADAEQRLREAEQKAKSEKTAAESAIQGKIQAREKARYEVQRAEHSLASMSLRAPFSGMISLVQVWREEGPAAFKPGDRAWPGAPLAEFPDASTLRVSTRIDETERSRLREDQPVTVHLDAIPDRQFSGRVSQISTIATMDLGADWPFPRDFNLLVTLNESDSRLRPGMKAQLNIVVERVPNALTIPVQASFQKSGHSVAYVVNDSRFEERVVDLGHRSSDRVLVVRGLRPGEKVALQDPMALE